MVFLFLLPLSFGFGRELARFVVVRVCGFVGLGKEDASGVIFGEEGWGGVVGGGRGGGGVKDDVVGEV